MYQVATRREFPDFFFEKGPLQTYVTPLNFGNSTYWMSSLACKQNENPAIAPLKPYDDNDAGLVDCEDVEDEYDIILNKSGKFTTSFYVPSSLLSYIIGAKAFRLKSLERSTNTQIKVPKQNETGNVKITGDTERNVASARTQISIIVMQRKDKLPISHFVSIPVISESIRTNLNAFKEAILRDPARGVTDSIFQNPEKLHLTICTVTLLDDEEIAAAKRVLMNCYDDVISKVFDKNRRYKIYLEGLEIMNDDPSSVNVLYGNVKIENENQNLQDISEAISEHFYKSGLARKQYDRVKLHVTLMNTSFRRPEEKQETFDAEDILKKYKDYHFGVASFQNIHLSIRFTGKDRYYESALVVNVGK